MRLLLTPGQALDKATAPALIAGLPPARALVADRGYDWQYLVDLVNAAIALASTRLWINASESRTQGRDL